MSRKRDSKYVSGVCDTYDDNRENIMTRGKDCIEETPDFRKYERGKKRPKCSSKNAIMARMNRLKKKYFVESLQKDVVRLSEENTKLKQTLEDQSSLVSSLRKEVHYLKGVLANNKEISMLLKSIQNTGLPVTTSLSKHTPSNQINSTADHNYVRTGSYSNIGSRFNDLFDEDNALFTLDDERKTPIIDDVDLSLSLSHNNIPDLPLLSPSDRSLYDTEFSGCCLVHPTIFDSPVVGSSADDELLMDAGVCLHVAKRRVSLEFCSTCSSNALSTWDDLDTVK